MAEPPNISMSTGPPTQETTADLAVVQGTDEGSDIQVPGLIVVVPGSIDREPGDVDLVEGAHEYVEPGTDPRFSGVSAEFATKIGISDQGFLLDCSAKLSLNSKIKAHGRTGAGAAVLVAGLSLVTGVLYKLIDAGDMNVANGLLVLCMLIAFLVTAGRVLRPQKGKHRSDGHGKGGSRQSGRRTPKG
jgi:hypothetical protein